MDEITLNDALYGYFPNGELTNGAICHLFVTAKRLETYLINN
jgi:hypothetical protein